MKRTRISQPKPPGHNIPQPEADNVPKGINYGNIIVFDPSMTAFGYVVLDFAGKVLKTGCIKTEPQAKKLRIRKGDDTMRRITEVNTELNNIIFAWRIIHIISELPHGSQSASAAEMLGIVKGIIQTIADTNKVSIEYYSEADAKKGLFGRDSATKLETIKKINVLYSVPVTGKKPTEKAPWSGVQYVDEAVADCLSVHNVARTQSPVLKLFNR